MDLLEPIIRIFVAMQIAGWAGDVTRILLRHWLGV